VRRALLLASVLLVAGCGGSDSGDSTPRVVDAGTAIALNGDHVTVRGFFSHERGTVLPKLCTSLDESYPPACSPPALPVSNLSKKQEQTLPLTRDPETGARWSNDEVELTGDIEEGALVVQ
jgi:hypothetical protein